MRSQAAGHGKISPRCVPEGASDGETTGSRQHIACMHSDSANFGKICAPCIRKAPQSAVGECAARASCRQGALSPSEALRSCTAHESCRPLTDLPLRRGSCPSNRIAGSPFNGLALAQGCLPRRPADTRHLPMPAACRARCSQRQAADGLRRRSSGSWPAVRPSPEGPPTASSRRAGRQRSAAQNLRRRPQARPGLRQRCRKRPSKGRVSLDGTIGTPHPFPIAQKSRPQELTPGSALSAFLAAYSPSEFQAVLRSAPFRLDAVRFSGLPRLLSSDSAHRN